MISTAIGFMTTMISDFHWVVITHESPFFAGHVEWEKLISRIWAAALGFQHTHPTDEPPAFCGVQSRQCVIGPQIRLERVLQSRPSHHTIKIVYHLGRLQTYDGGAVPQNPMTYKYAN